MRLPTFFGSETSTATTIRLTMMTATHWTAGKENLARVRGTLAARSWWMGTRPGSSGACLPTAKCAIAKVVIS